MNVLLRWLPHLLESRVADENQSIQTVSRRIDGLCLRCGRVLCQDSFHRDRYSQRATANSISNRVFGFNAPDVVMHEGKLQLQYDGRIGSASLLEYLQSIVKRVMQSEIAS